MGKIIYGDMRATRLRLLNLMEPYVSHILRNTWQYQRDAVTYAEIKAMQVTGTVSDSLVDAWNKDYVFVVINKLSPWILKAVEGAEASVKRQNALWDFDIAPAAMQEWTKTRGAELVVNVTEEQRKALQHLLELGNSSKALSVDEMSRLIRPTIGLTQRESRAVYNYYNHLRGDSATISATKQKQLQSKASTYAGRLHRHRSMRIARTELAFSYNYAAEKTIVEAVNQGLIGAVKKVWSTAGDNRVCPYCKGLDGKAVGQDEMFKSGKNEVLLPPLHPHCRCGVKYEEEDDE